MLTTFGQNDSLLTVFNDCKVKYMVVGGLAVNYYCPNREVGDLDLLVSPTTKNATNIAQAFAELDSRGLVKIDLCKLDYRKLSEFGVQVPLKKFLNADILTPLPEFDFCTSYINSVEVKINNIPAQIISCHDLLVHKRSRIEHLNTELVGENRDIKMLCVVCGP